VEGVAGRSARRQDSDAGTTQALQDELLRGGGDRLGLRSVVVPHLDHDPATPALTSELGEGSGPRHVTLAHRHPARLTRPRLLHVQREHMTLASA
jgi:hypothetical protein